jgi:multidrug efflux system outer membrane protein
MDPVKNLFFISLILTLAACTGVKTTQSKKMPIIPESFKSSQKLWSKSAPAESLPRGDWWKVFEDEVINQLCEHARIDSATIHLAEARLLQSKAGMKNSKSNLSPQVGFAFSASEQGGALINAAGGTGALYSGAATISYDADLFNRISKGVDVSKLEVEARKALLRNTELFIQSEVVGTYFNIRMLDDERKLLRLNLTSYQQTLALNKINVELGTASDFDVSRLETEIASTASELLGLDRKRAESEHMLAMLIGDLASNFKLEEVNTNWIAPIIPEGLPARLLERRPDISAAQFALMSSQAKFGLAKSAWLPSISFNAAIGSASPSVADFFSMSMRAWSYGVLLGMPLFDGGRRDSNILNANAEMDMAVANYREKVLLSFREVEDCLSSLHFLTEQIKVQEGAVSSSERALSYSNSRYNNGLSSQLDVLDATRTELKNKRTMIQLQSAQVQFTVTLIRALGGSWDTQKLEN